MNATDELRRMLNERGVEWSAPNDITHYIKTMWRNGPFEYTAVETSGGEFSVYAEHRYWLTPEQAIEATLGRGTCHNAMPLLPGGMPYPDSWMCSECGGRMDGIILEIGNFCPNCGRRVEQ